MHSGNATQIHTHYQVHRLADNKLETIVSSHHAVKNDNAILISPSDDSSSSSGSRRYQARFIYHGNLEVDPVEIG